MEKNTLNITCSSRKKSRIYFKLLIPKNNDFRAQDIQDLKFLENASKTSSTEAKSTVQVIFSKRCFFYPRLALTSLTFL